MSVQVHVLDVAPVVTVKDAIAPRAEFAICERLDCTQLHERDEVARDEWRAWRIVAQSSEHAWRECVLQERVRLVCLDVGTRAVVLQIQPVSADFSLSRQDSRCRACCCSLAPRSRRALQASVS